MRSSPPNRRALFGFCLAAALLVCAPVRADLGYDAPRFDAGNGFALDGRTHLYWTLCAYGQTWEGGMCTGTTQKVSLEEAQKIVAYIRKATGTAWRLPTREEFKTLIDIEGRHVVNQALFGDLGDCECFYWTSTPFDVQRHYAADFSFNGLNKDNEYVMEPDFGRSRPAGAVRPLGWQGAREGHGVPSHGDGPGQSRGQQRACSRVHLTPQSGQRGLRCSRARRRRMERTKAAGTAPLVFAMAAFPIGAFVTTLSVYLPNYYSRTVGLSLASVGFAFAFVRLLDILLDPALGVAMDLTRTWAGRFRPWLLCSAPVLMLGTSAIYFAKSGITTGWVILWLLVLYAGYSMLVLSQAAWAAALVREYHGRARVYGLIQAVGVMGSLTVLILPQLLAKLAPHLPLRGVPLMGAILMVAAPVTALITVLFAHEPARVEARSSSGSLGDYWELLRRGSTIRVLGADFFCNMGPAITAPLYLFFFEEARGYSLSEANILLVVYISGTLLGPAFWARPRTASASTRH